MSNFESQSITLIETLMKRHNMSREIATKTWFSSRTYHEIIRRKLTYISAMRAYTELNMEFEKNPNWMQNSFDI